MAPRLKRLAVFVFPEIGGDVTPLLKDRLRLPVLRFARQPITPLITITSRPASARQRAKVPPPAPLPMINTSTCLSMVGRGGEQQRYGVE